MTKIELIAEMSRKTGVEKAVSAKMLDAFIDTVKTSLIIGEKVNLLGVGSFILKTRAEKVARNISTNTAIIVPEHKLPAFKPTKELCQAVNGK